MKSIKLLPLEKRDKATVKQLLDALETAEAELKEYDTKSTKVIYKSMKYAVCELSKEIEQLVWETKEKKRNVIELEEKVFEKMTKFFDLVGDYDKTLESLRSKINPDEANKIDQETSVHPTIKFAKHG